MRPSEPAAPGSSTTATRSGWTNAALSMKSVTTSGTRMSSLPSHPGHGTAPRATAHPWNGRSAGSAARDNLSMPVGPVPTAPPDPLDEVRRASRHGGYAVYLGASEGRFVFSRPESGVLVLGPPRSGKTTSIVVPNVLAACGPVVVASTKRDILDATYRARLRCGPCIVFDPG